MDGSKEILLSKLLQPASSSSKSSSLIQELDPSPLEEITTTPPLNSKCEPKQNDEPTMFELMMAAQKDAAEEKKKLSTVESQVKETTFANGFKKGFFGASKSSKASTPNAQSTASKTVKSPKSDFDDDIIDLTNVTGKKSTANPPKSNSKKVNLNMAGTAQSSQDNNFVFADVQKALDEEQHPVLQQINKKEWVTPDLLAVFQGNDILARGFKDPKCTAAMQMMQSDPKAALARFKDDAEVTLFLKEFGKVMATHFEKLGEAQAATAGADQKNPAASSSSATGAAIQEVGPLQAKALQKQKDQQRAAAAPSTSTAASSKAAGKSTATPSSSAGESEEERVQRILQDEELRSLLMDVSFQALLVECNDPVKYQQHMRNPETARKIRKLHESGLVKSAV